MANQRSSMGEEALIRALIDDQAKALRAKDADGVLATLAENLVTFDLAPPLRSAGAEARSKERLTDWFATWRGPLGYEVRDMDVTASGDIAFCHGFIQISGTKTSGERNAVWARQTLCLHKIAGVWKIVHEHTSVPFYMDGSLKAAVDLKP